LTDGCRVCGSPRVQPRFPTVTLDLNLCRECGAIFRAGEVSDEDLKKIYDRDYYLETWPGSLGKFFSEFNPTRHHKTKYLLRQLGELDRLCGGPGRLLDVGCANGVFPWLAQNAGWRATGLEVSPFAAEWGRKQFGVEIIESGIEDLPPEPVYDAITFWDTIEHLPAPSAALYAAFLRLKPGGYLAVLTPDTDSLVSGLCHNAYRLAPRRSRPLIEKLYHQDHLSFFNRGSLAQALLAQGFEVHWMESYDEDPRDTETQGLTRAGLFLTRAVAVVFQRHHELLVFARRPGPDR